MIPHLLRTGAIVLAVIAAVDPAITTERRTRPYIAVIDLNDDSGLALAERVTHELERDFTIVHAPLTQAAATVIVGTQVPPSAGLLAGPVFAIGPDRARATVRLEAVQAPAHAPLAARVPVDVAVRVHGAAGRELEVTLRAGDLVIDRALRTIAANEELVQVPLAFVPAAAGAAALRVTAQLTGSQESASADLAIDVRDLHWSVLFLDRRPSWLSTFVRRALERDARFAVTSRIHTARNVTTAAGGPPGSLTDLTPVALFDVILIGAPDALSERDVAGLDAYLRRRGGSVVLLLDRAAGGAYERLTQLSRRAEGRRGRGIVIRTDALASGLRATEVIWPDPLPAGAAAVAVDSANHPVVWRSAVGAGRLVVSGALDAWKFRDPTTSSFDAFWQTTVAEAAQAGPPPIDVRVGRAIIEPGATTDVIVTLRSTALDDATARTARASLSATLETPDGNVPVRMWPDGSIGRFRGTLRAPARAGTSRIIVTSDGLHADATIMVAQGTRQVSPDEQDVLSAFAESRGGRALAESELPELSGALERTMQPVLRRETWHPMRSPWWILPFALALSAEWWWRRRRGLG
jgi:hypothetical protein